MDLAIATLNAERDIALHNAPIHRTEGNIAQAEHAEQRAAELGQAAQSLAADAEIARAMTETPTDA